MSTFATFEESVEGSRPIETYQFALGSTTFEYTSADDSITVGVTTFCAEAISRSAIVEGGDRRNKTITIVMPTANSFVSQYIATPPAQNATVSIFRYQEDVITTQTQVLIFKGVVQGVRFIADGYTAELIVQTIESAIIGLMPRRVYSTSCNHLLYGVGCTVDPATHVHTATVTAVNTDQTQITVDGLNASGIDGTGGYAQPDGVTDFRLIVSQSGDVITVLLPFISNPNGTTLRVFRGCDHVVDGDCRDTFDNVINFDGFPWIPSRNFFKDGIDNV